MKKIVFLLLFLLPAVFVRLSAKNEVDTLIFKEPVAIQFNADSAAHEYLSLLTPEQKEKSDSYFEGGYLIILWDFLIGLVIALIFLSLGLSRWINRVASKAKKTDIKNLIYILLYMIFAFLLAFPFSVYTGFFREHQYGLSNMTFADWFSEEMISFLLVLVFGSVLILLLYWIMKKKTKSWWLWGSGLSIVFLIFLLFIGPVFISPLFNKYEPLEEGIIKDEILSLARGNGIPVDNVYQFNASKQSTRISANVSGFGSTIRVSLNDNLLNKCTPAEIKSVMAHELGHYVLNHMYKLVLYFSIVIVIGFAFVDFLMKKVIARFGPKWEINDISDITSLPLLVLVFSVFIIIARPVFNNVSRTTESEADIFGLNAAREPDGFASVTMKLSEYRKIDPGAFEEFMFYDHPSGRARVVMSMKWKAENLKVIKVQDKFKLPDKH